MLRPILLASVVMLAMSPPIQAAPPPEELRHKLTQTIRKHRPEAQLEVTKDAFTAKAGTMMYTVHSRSKTGEVYERTHQEEGPNFKGFVLSVAVYPGPYQGAAAIPQTLQGPYFQTFLDATPTDKGDEHYLVHFSYGSRLDADLKRAIMDAIPRTQFSRPVIVPEPGK